MTRSHHRPSAAQALAGALSALVLLLLAPGALARTTHPAGTGSCSSGKSEHHTTHGVTRHCAKHGSSHRSATHRHAKHKLVRKHSQAPVALIPATCEDETLPLRGAGGTYLCDDGSEPSCEDGIGASLAPGTSQPMCLPASEAAAPEAGILVCTGQGGECASEEAVCETEGVEGSTPGCEVIAEETGEESS
jgi:hypothetical protein